MATETARSTWDSIVLDARRYPVWYRAPGFYVSLSYRLRRLRKLGPAGRWLLLPLDMICGALRRANSSVRIPSDVPVGPGFSLPHPDGIIINNRARIGACCTLFQQTTLGEWKGAAPELADGAVLFAGAKVFGAVHVGRDAKIGANAVVRDDVPDGASVAAAASTVLRGNGSAASSQ